jgi:dipeptidyl aminopeptidase/acylaminoacyl peptidase
MQISMYGEVCYLFTFNYLAIEGLMLKELNLSDNALWKQRFRAPKVVWARLASHNPARGIACTNQSGVLQLYGWEVPSGRLTQLTDKPVGLLLGTISADGKDIYYLDDTGGNEIGHFVRVSAGGGEPEDITPDMPPYASFGFNESFTGTIGGFMAAGRDGFQMIVMDKSDAGKFSAPRPMWHSAMLSGGPLFSASSDIAIAATVERTGKNEFSLVAVETGSGTKIADLFDQDASIEPVGFAPVPGDNRLLATTDKSGFARPLIWNPRTEERQDIALPQLQGEVQAWDWSPDGKRLLLCQLHQAQYQLYVYSLADDTLTKLDHPGGTLGGFFGGQFAPNGEIFLTWQDSTHPSCLIALDGARGEQTRVVLSAGDAPGGRDWRSVTFPSSDGVELQAWVATPEGEGPFPTILHTHGGPTAVETNVFDSMSQAWLDHGFAFISVNYRGSTTFGKDFERAIWGNLGQVEVEDMAAARDWIVANKIADPDAILVTGWSYGGYLTLQSLGKRPDLWAGGMAGIAIADWVLMYEDQAETLRGYQRALFGGSPQEKPDAHQAASPITYAEKVRAPLLVIQGSNDTRCPARQMQVYEEKMKSLGKSIQVKWFDAGHGSRANEEQIEHQEIMLRFAYQVLG